MHWSKFTDCIRDLRSSQAAGPDIEYYGKLANLIESSQKFYFPTSNNFMEGAFDDDIKSLIRLPYDAISILSDATFDCGDGRTMSENTWMMTVAFHAHGETNSKIGLCNLQNLPPDAMIIGSVSCINNNWISLPFLCNAVDRKGAGFELRSIFTQKWHSSISQKLHPGVADGSIVGDPFQIILSDMTANFTLICNLCAVLNLKGTERVSQLVPPKLAKARERRGKDRLYDYHVVKIGGDVWDSP